MQQLQLSETKMKYDDESANERCDKNYLQVNYERAVAEGVGFSLRLWNIVLNLKRKNTS